MLMHAPVQRLCAVAAYMLVQPRARVRRGQTPASSARGLRRTSAHLCGSVFVAAEVTMLLRYRSARPRLTATTADLWKRTLYAAGLM